MTQADQLAGRVALVTGAGNGIGRAIALKFASNGAQVVLVGRDEAKLISVSAEIQDVGASAIVLPCDTSDPAAVQALSLQMADQQVSVLVNNAGIAGPVANLVDIEPDAWSEVFDVNVKGVYLMCKALLPGMIERKYGDVINIASVTGKRPLPQRTPYAASKMAVLGLTVTLAWEVGPHGVSVNSLSPGPVDGPRMRRNFRLTAERNGSTTALAEAEFISRAALGRMVTEDEVANAALAMLAMPGLCGADIDLSAGMIGR